MHRSIDQGRAKSHSKFLLMRARHNSGLSQVQLAGIFNVSQQLVEQWENPGSNSCPPIWILECLSDPMFRELISHYNALHQGVFTSFPKAPKTDGKLDDEIVDFTSIAARLIEKFTSDPAGAERDLEAMQDVLHRTRAEFFARHQS